jgi:hypothetical protein
MILEEFIEQNRSELKRNIQEIAPARRSLDDDELALWVLNDEDLYNWALESGVDFEEEVGG